MVKSILLSAMLLSIVFAAGPGMSAVAAESHDHGLSATLRLDNGKKWQTDAPLRQGMTGMHAAMAKSLAPIHKNKFSQKQYEALAAELQKQIDYVTAECKLPEEADQQLHIVLEQIIDAIAEMKTPKGRDAAVRVAQALDLYGKHFDHAGWRMLAH